MLHNNYNNQYHRHKTNDKGANKLQSSTSNIWWRTYVPTHNAKHTHAQLKLPWCRAYLCTPVTGCVSGMGEGESKGNEVEETPTGEEQRERTKEVDYLLSLLQRHLQPAYFLLILLLHLVHLLVMSSDLFLQGSFQGCKLPLPPLQHILLLLLGQENLLQLQLQMHHVLLKSDS